MFWNWFRPTCPIDLREKAWIELRLGWLADRFGMKRLLDSPWLAVSEDFFPGGYDASEEAAQRIFWQVCGHMGIRADDVTLSFFPQKGNEEFQGFYDLERHEVSISLEALCDQAQLISVMAHELSHHLLMSEGHLTGDERDHEFITDLLPVFLGFGPIVANASIVDHNYSSGGWQWWVLGRSGYLPTHLYGYALAVIAWARNDLRPSWGRRLRPDARHPFQQAIRYLTSSNDAIFGPGGWRWKPDSVSERRLLGSLREGTPTEKLTTLWYLREQKFWPREERNWLVERLTDREISWRCEAAFALAEVEHEVPGVAEPLRAMLECREVECIAAAAHALGALRIAADQVVPELSWLLASSDERVVIRAAALALAQFGQFESRCLPAFIDRFKTSLVDIDPLTTNAIATLFVSVGGDLRALIFDQWCHDQELRRRAMAAFDEARARLEGRGPKDPNTGNDIAYGQLGLLPIFFPQHVDSPGGRRSGGAM